MDRRRATSALAFAWPVFGEKSGVMNDFDYPRSTTSKCYELDLLGSPFPDQLTTLKLVRDGLNGNTYFHRHHLRTLYDGDDPVSIATSICELAEIR